METLKISAGLVPAERANALEIISGACMVVLCNPDIGRSFVRSLIGQGDVSECRVYYQGEPLLLSDGQSARKTGLSTLDEGLYGRLKLKDYLAFWNGLYEARTPVGEVLGLFGLAAKANERISKLSYSEKRLLGFARSILHDPQLVVWEEPEQNLDLESCMIVRKMIDELMRKGKTVLLTCSSLEQALSVSARIYRFDGSLFTPIAVQESTEPGEEASSPAEVEEEGESARQPMEPKPEINELAANDPVLARLMVKTDDKYVFIEPSRLFYIESNDGITRLYAEEGEFPCLWTLAELEEKLLRYRFYRCHRSYIVNLDRIAELIVWSRKSYSLVLQDGKRSRIPLSKGKFEEFKAMVGV